MAFLGALGALAAGVAAAFLGSAAAGVGVAAAFLGGGVALAFWSCEPKCRRERINNSVLRQQGPWSSKMGSFRPLRMLERRR